MLKLPCCFGQPPFQQCSALSQYRGGRAEELEWQSSWMHDEFFSYLRCNTYLMAMQATRIGLVELCCVELGVSPQRTICVVPSHSAQSNCHSKDRVDRKLLCKVSQRSTTFWASCKWEEATLTSGGSCATGFDCLVFLFWVWWTFLLAGWPFMLIPCKFPYALRVLLICTTAIDFWTVSFYLLYQIPKFSTFSRPVPVFMYPVYRYRWV